MNPFMSKVCSTGKDFNAFATLEAVATAGRAAAPTSRARGNP
ncbi:hypothetical protein I552_5858 [Mycobacterium xenopi 3993]|nr:hypothetical protein I552_5858 [Mycobacterium xenopi 3993]